MHSRITVVSFFYRFPQETLKIREMPVDNYGHNFSLDDVIIMKFGLNV